VYVFVDTETTGLPARRFAHSYTEQDVWPRVVSISWAIFQAKDQTLKHVYHIIQPCGFIIPDDATKIHGITTEHALANGRPLSQVLQELTADVKSHKPSLIIAHNIAFDLPILLCEMSRVKLDTPIKYIPTYCTMFSSTNYCALPHPNGWGYKWPRLSELHTKLFSVGFTGGHDASQDVLACARCYFRLVELGLAQDYKFQVDDICLPQADQGEPEHIAVTSEINDLLVKIRAFAEDHAYFDTRFLESVERQFRRRGCLSPKQVSALRNIINGWGMQGYRRMAASESC
jgi:DNA polymerase-3 subunit alpha